MWTKIVRFLADGSKRCCSGARRGDEVACCFLFTLRGRGGVGQEPGVAQPRALSSPLAGEDAEGRRGGGAAAASTAGQGREQTRPLSPTLSRKGRGGQKRLCFNCRVPSPPQIIAKGRRRERRSRLLFTSPLAGEDAKGRSRERRSRLLLTSPLAGEDAEGRRGGRRSRCCLSPSERREARGCIPRAHDISHPPSRR